jgi:CRP-like cAMP-binding protein
VGWCGGEINLTKAIRVQRLTHLIRYLECRDEVSDEEKHALQELPWRIKTFAANETIIRQGSIQTDSCLLLEGFAARSQGLADGTRQFTAVHIAGDFVDLHAFTLKIMDHDVMSIKACTVAFAPHNSLKKLTENLPHLGRLLWLSTTIDAAIQRAWIVSMGRRSARDRMAHLICELFTRLKLVGLVKGNSFELPITQIDLADIMGLSAVHANRTLQTLRRELAVTWEGQTITIRDWDQLRSLAQFDPTYLNLEKIPR